MFDWFKLGGSAMFLTLLFGALGIAVAVKYAMDPYRRLLPLTAGLGVLTLLTGALGCVTGVIKSLHCLPRVEPDERWIWMVGLGESLVNVAFALAMVAIAALAIVIGVFRRSQDALGGIYSEP